MLLWLRLKKHTAFKNDKVYYINGPDTLPPPLSTAEEDALLSEIRDEDARHALIEHNLRLVVYVAKRFENTGATLEELISIGTVGLVKAVNTYEINKGTQFATFAARCIENEILMLLRANKKFKNDASLVSVVGTDKDGSELTLLDLLCESSDSVFDKVDREIERDKLMEFIKNTLNKTEYTIICLRYGLKGGKTYAQREVAKFLKISRSYISRIEKRSIEKLKEAVKKGQFNC